MTKPNPKTMKVWIVAQFSNLTSESILEAFSSEEKARNCFKGNLDRDFQNENYLIRDDVRKEALAIWSYYIEDDGTGCDWTTEIRTLEIDEED